MTKLATYMPSFVLGIAAVLDLGGTLKDPVSDKDPLEKDMEALRSDWLAVGEDLRSAMSAVQDD